MAQDACDTNNFDKVIVLFQNFTNLGINSTVENTL